MAPTKNPARLILRRSHFDAVQRWARALESGTYLQGTKALRISNHDIRDQFCCLGVLCDLDDPTAWATSKLHLTATSSFKSWKHGGSGIPPRTLVAGVPWDDVSMAVAQTNPDGGLLNLNDSGVPFPQIAAAIRNAVRLARPGETPSPLNRLPTGAST